MPDNGTEAREPDGEEPAEESSAGEAHESGPEATLEALRSPEKYRLSEAELDARDERSTGPRKEQGPLRDDERSGEAAVREEAAEEVEETMPPELESEIEQDESTTE